MCPLKPIHPPVAKYFINKLLVVEIGKVVLQCMPCDTLNKRNLPKYKQKRENAG